MGFMMSPPSDDNDDSIPDSFSGHVSHISVLSQPAELPVMVCNENDARMNDSTHSNDSSEEEAGCSSMLYYAENTMLNDIDVDDTADLAEQITVRQNSNSSLTFDMNNEQSAESEAVIYQFSSRGADTFSFAGNILYSSSFMNLTDQPLCSTVPNAPIVRWSHVDRVLPPTSPSVSIARSGSNLLATLSTMNRSTVTSMQTPAAIKVLNGVVVMSAPASNVGSSSSIPVSAPVGKRRHSGDSDDSCKIVAVQSHDAAASASMSDSDSEDSDADSEDSSGSDSGPTLTIYVFAKEFLERRSKLAFWQYNAQSRGPKGKRICTSIQVEDPHVLHNFSDPVFSRDHNAPVAQYSSKSRRGEGNDTTANPNKLLLIGRKLKRAEAQYERLTSRMTRAARNDGGKLNRQRNKLASRVCRLRKKAQHEANKLKLQGLECEHGQLMNVLRSLWVAMPQHVVASSAATAYPPEPLTDQLQQLISKHLTVMIAGHTTDYVNIKLEEAARKILAKQPDSSS